MRKRSAASTGRSRSRTSESRLQELDLHGLLVAEAEKVFFDKLNTSRLRKTLEVICFITGTGLIRERLLALAKEQDLYHYIPMANRGCVVIEFE